jgi:hypothetical protein
VDDPRSFRHVARELGLRISASLEEEWYSTPAEPHAEYYHAYGAQAIKAMARHIFYLKLAESDVATLRSEPAKQERWVELWTGLEPAMTFLQDLISNKWHLTDRIDLDEIDVFLPGFGRPLKPFFASQSHFVFIWAAWVNEWRSVFTRWSREDFGKLQPVVPGPTELLLKVGQGDTAVLHCDWLRQWLSLLWDLYSNIAVIHVVFCQNDNACRPGLSRRRSRR